jgi:hypothetical protein
MSSLQGAPLPDFTLPYTSHAPGGQNGRVSFHPAGGPSATGYTVPDAAGWKHPTQTEEVFSGQMLLGNVERTPLSDAFFSRSNFDILQQTIQAEVYKASGPKKYRIDRQNIDELKTVARAFYLQYAKHTPYDIKGQVKELNEMVVKWCVPRILSEVEAHFHYLKDISTLPVPLPQPIHLSSAGTKSLPFKVPL